MARFVLFACLSLAIFVHSDAVDLRIRVDDANGDPLPCRIHLSDGDGQPQRPPKLPFWFDHFVCDGVAKLNVAPGRYRYEIERGPEYERAAGKIDVTGNGVSELAVRLDRITDLRSDGWYSGDLHVHRLPQDVELLMRAEDLDYAPVITWWNKPATNVAPTVPIDVRFDGHRVYTLEAGEDERQGGALLYVGLDRPLDLTVQSREFPSPMRFVDQARSIDPRVWIDIEKPFWWDVPCWLASGKMNSIGLANNHLNRSGMYVSEAWGNPRDAGKFPPPRGNGFWSQEIYYHLLESGIRLPPSAGSASGVLKNPVGYNRVYVQLQGQPFTRQNWLEALRDGRCFVTNGPLLRVTADGKHSGTTLQMHDGKPSVISLAIEVASNDPIAALEVINNGRVVRRLPVSPRTHQSMTVDVTFDQPGWFLVRAIADVENTFRFASTAPWFVESETPRVSRQSAQFFLDWVDRRIAEVVANVGDQEQADAVLKPHREAREFWAERLSIANATGPPMVSVAPSPPTPRLPRDAMLLRRDNENQPLPVTDVEGWAIRRQEIVDAMQSVMGTLPGDEKRCALAMRVEQEIDRGDYVERLISYQSEPGCRVPAYLLVPKSVLGRSGRQAPAILCLHPTDDQIGHRVVVDSNAKANRQYASELARRGFVTLAPGYPLLAEYQPNLNELGWESGTLKAVWDNIRGLDLLESLPYVSGDRFGCIGHSLGGHNSVYTAVFDQRIRAIVSSCGLDSYLDYYGGDPDRWLPERGWCQTRYMPRLAHYRGRLKDIPFDFHEMIAALAPRHVLISAPLDDGNFDASSVDGVVDSASKVFALFDAEPNLRLVHPDCGHDFPPSVRESAYALFDQVLR